MRTFVVRVYRSGQDSVPHDDRLRGVVEEISTGRQATFHDAKQLLSILDRQGDENAAVPMSGASSTPAGGGSQSVGEGS